MRREGGGVDERGGLVDASRCGDSGCRRDPVGVFCGGDVPADAAGCTAHAEYSYDVIAL